MTNRFAPRSEDEARDTIRDALAAEESLELVGAGSLRGYGRPVAADAVLDLSALDGIVSYQPEELVLTLGPGVRLCDIEALLAGQRQMLAFEPPDLAPLWGLPAGRGTLGGALMTGLGGPRRPFAGAPRDHLLGIRGINGFGEVFAAGGRVVKNVTGYDLPKLMAGSLGTLGPLTEVTVKVLPLPPVSQTLVIPGLDDGAAIALMSRALGGPAAVSGAAHLPESFAASMPVAKIANAGSSVTLLRLEGVAPSVLARAHGLREQMQRPDIDCLEDEASLELWRAVRDLRPFTADPARPLWRISLPASKAAACAAAIARRSDIRLCYDWGGALLWIELPATTTDAEHQAVRTMLAEACGSDGHATLLRAADDVRRRIAPMQPLEPGLAALTKRVKARFDPQGLFNPGRLTEDW